MKLRIPTTITIDLRKAAFVLYLFVTTCVTGMYGWEHWRPPSVAKVTADREWLSRDMAALGMSGKILIDKPGQATEPVGQGQCEPVDNAISVSSPQPVPSSSASANGNVDPSKLHLVTSP